MTMVKNGSITAMTILFLVLGSIASIQVATTEDGRKVILKEDGSWKFATQSDLVAVKLMKSNDQKPGDPANGSDASRVQMKAQASDEPERAGFLDVVKGDRAFDIRKSTWGMERAEVKKSESLQLLRETQNSLEYKFKLIGIDSKVIYKFTVDKSGKPRLSGAQYVIEQDDVNPARFFDDYKSLKGYLRQLYGFPVSDENNWTNDMYKADEKNWGFAISLGFLTCKALWKNTRTRTTINLSGSNHILSTNIEYFGIPSN
jgi:hypothetical protein